MTETATMTSKGQITIPKRIRERLGLDAGDKVDFLLSPDGSVRMEVRRQNVRELAGMLHRPGMKALTVEQMDAAVARHLRARR
jgi:AbrB family looped-hinge helix DNA binding protein